MGTSGTEYWNFNDFLNDSSGTSTSCNTASSTDSSNYIRWTYSTAPSIKRILVQAPEDWEEKDCKAFSNLLNNQTDTGWSVELFIKGEVKIADPNIETRTMKQFIPLLMNDAGRADKETINDFFEEHPINEGDV